ncbi:MAG: biotin synthase BioB [Gammaproteobacteria bacterium]|nr:biotin synthase BioB [Gammaproteobacteria bacterium]
MQSETMRNDWKKHEVLDLYQLPFNDLLYLAHRIFRENHDPNKVQVSTLLSVKTGSCSEDCAYCPQSGHYDTEIEKERLLSLDEVKQNAETAREAGASRFCMGAAWRNPSDKNLDQVIKMIEIVKDLGMETCVTIGMLTEPQAQKLKIAGLDYYNHNLDTSPEFYGSVITTRTYQDRLDTLEHVRNSGINVCSGGILGMGESREDRAGLLLQLANLPQHPESVPINMLIKIKGTPLENVDDLDPFEFIRTIAIARILMPKTYVRLSAGREEMNEQTQALCFFAGANSIFYGETLLTAKNPATEKDRALFNKLGIEADKVNSTLSAELNRDIGSTVAPEHGHEQTVVIN